jgi:hypothetical protein
VFTGTGSGFTTVWLATSNSTDDTSHPTSRYQFGPTNAGNPLTAAGPHTFYLWARMSAGTLQLTGAKAWRSA